MSANNDASGTIVIWGFISYPDLVEPNSYTGKKEFLLRFSRKFTKSIENKIREIADSIRHDGFYDSMRKPRFKAAKKEESDLVDMDCIRFRSDEDIAKCTGGWEFMDIDGNPMDASQFGYGDYVKVLISIGTQLDKGYGNIVYLNARKIKLIKSAGHGSCSFDGAVEFGEISQDEKLPPPVGNKNLED